MVGDEKEPNGYVREKLFNERTGNIKTSIETLDKTVKEVLELFRNGQTEQDEKIQDNCDQVASICQHLDDEAAGEDTQRKDSSVRLAKWAVVLALISIIGTLLLGTVGVILKAMKII